MDTNNIALSDARKRLTELIDRIQAGENFVITRRGRAVARLEAVGGHEAIASLRASREGVSLGRLKSRELIVAGRR